jgi:hypothetical protein
MMQVPESRPIVMLCLGSPIGSPGPHNNRYLRSMDFTRSDGLVTCADIADAKRFADMVEALTYLRTVPECHPIRRSDGKPNRPLFAWSWEFPAAPPSPSAGGAKTSG